MKSSFSIITILALALLLTECSTPQNQIIREVRTDSGVITEIDLSMLPGDTLFMNLSDIVSEVELIPLETNEKCLIGNAWERFTDDDFLIGTQNFPGPARLYRFDKDGKFLNEIGRGGKGPEEHQGYIVNIHQVFEDGRVLVSWDDYGKGAQLFDFDGNYLDDVKVPFDRFNNCYQISDETWFTTGRCWDKPRQAEDSVVVIFYTSDGTVSGFIPRTLYPHKNDNGYFPSGLSKVYRYDDSWKLYMSGNDTVYRLIGMKLQPENVILPGQNAMDYNTGSLPNQNTGKHQIDIVAETDNYWILNKNVLTELDVFEYSPGSWAGSSSFSSNLILIDKQTKTGRYIRIRDDVFSLFPDSCPIEDMYWHSKNFFSDDHPVFWLQEQVENNKEKVAQSVYGQKLIQIIDSLNTDSNPVVFKFWTRDRIDIRKML